MLMTESTGLDMTCASTVAMVAWDRTVEDFLSHDKETSGVAGAGARGGSGLRSSLVRQGAVHDASRPR